MTVWQTMKNAIDEGLKAEGVLPGGLNVQRKAKFLYEQTPHVNEPGLLEFQRIAAYAYAVAEQNAGNGTIVTAPTCGACGIVPAVLKYAQETKGFTDHEICRALATAGIDVHSPQSIELHIEHHGGTLDGQHAPKVATQLYAHVGSPQERLDVGGVGYDVLIGHRKACFGAEYEVLFALLASLLVVLSYGRRGYGQQSQYGDKNLFHRYLIYK
jgi:hypothetical protein